MLFENAKDACDNFEPNRVWMKNSGNMCWGMGAANRIPCIHCGLMSQTHESKRLDEEIERRRNDRASSGED